MQNNLILNNSNKSESEGSRYHFQLSSILANNCPNFTLDDDDECVAEETISCLNCRYRKWTQHSFLCLKDENLV